MVVIMNSAFRFFTDLFRHLNKLNEFSSDKVELRVHFAKITTQHLNVAVVEKDKVRHNDVMK